MRCRSWPGKVRSSTQESEVMPSSRCQRGKCRSDTKYNRRCCREKKVKSLRRSCICLSRILRSRQVRREGRGLRQRRQGTSQQGKRCTPWFQLRRRRSQQRTPNTDWRGRERWQWSPRPPSMCQLRSPCSQRSHREARGLRQRRQGTSQQGRSSMWTFPSVERNSLPSRQNK